MTAEILLIFVFVFTFFFTFVIMVVVMIVIMVVIGTSKTGKQRTDNGWQMSRPKDGT